MANPGVEYSRAEYDHENNRVVALETAFGEIHTTNAPRKLGSKTEWVDVKTTLPEGYDGRFHNLLNEHSKEFSYDEKANVVLVKYPDAEFTPEAMRKTLVEMVKSGTRQELSQTDWYIIRSIERDVPVPNEVKSIRKEVLDAADRLESEIAACPDAELSDFKVTLPFGNPDARNRNLGETGTPKGADGRKWRTDATSEDVEGEPIEPEEEN